MSKSKKDKKVVINASFEELVKMSVGDNPKPNPKSKSIKMTDIQKEIIEAIRRDEFSLLTKRENVKISIERIYQLLPSINKEDVLQEIRSWKDVKLVPDASPHTIEIPERYFLDKE